MTRKSFLLTTAAAASTVAVAQFNPPNPTPAGVQPITPDERRQRLERARRLMAAHHIAAIVMEPGTSMLYFTGTRWGRSERTFAFVLPAQGEPAWVVPAFEEGRAREVIRMATSDIRVWQEDENPSTLIAGVLKDRGIRGGRVGIEESVRFFISDGLRHAAPAIELTSADPITAGCRMIKTPAELAILKRANEITLEAIALASKSLQDGMMQSEFRGHLDSAFRSFGVRGGGLILFGKYTASPHGTLEPQRLREGDFVLVDAGCEIEGYSSDVTRTWVVGKPTARQRQIWDLEKKAQNAAFAAVRPGVTCESVDAAARQVITDAGFGPGYKLPGLPHRTGHGIGMDGHEWTNLVRGNKTPLAVGMCFSNEPTIAIPGEFGIRLEDCFHVTEEGARPFSRLSPSIDQPFG